MNTEARTIKRYSSAFKRKVVREIEQGRFSITQARQLYDIGGAETIQKWIRRFGKQHLLSQIVVVKMKNQPNKVNALQAEKQALESALAQAQLKILALEATLQAAEEVYEVDLKKNFGTVRSPSPMRR